MIKIKNVVFNRGIDYILEDETYLYEMDWNTSCYRQGYDYKKGKDIKHEFYPVYEDGEIIGFNSL